jgi:hypothetical protein
MRLGQRPQAVPAADAEVRQGAVVAERHRWCVPVAPIGSRSRQDPPERHALSLTAEAARTTP